MKLHLLAIAIYLVVAFCFIRWAVRRVWRHCEDKDTAIIETKAVEFMVDARKQRKADQ